jgi:hypothetical protein
MTIKKVRPLDSVSDQIGSNFGADKLQEAGMEKQDETKRKRGDGWIIS